MAGTVLTCGSEVKCEHWASRWK